MIDNIVNKLEKTKKEAIEELILSLVSVNEIPSRVSCLIKETIETYCIDRKPVFNVQLVFGEYSVGFEISMIKTNLAL
jgi:hypothetical protein